MKIKALIITIVLITFSEISAQEKLRPSEERNIEVPKFIKSVIQECSGKDKSVNHDVVIVEMEMKKSSYANEIAEMLLREVPTSTVLIHRTFAMIEKFLVHAASFIIIVTDHDDPVRYFQIIFKSKSTYKGIFAIKLQSEIW